MVNNKGVSLIELMVATAILGIGAWAIINMSKIEGDSSKLVAAQDIKAFMTKELMTTIENKSNCEALLKNKNPSSTLNFVSTDGKVIKVGSIINETHKLTEFKFELPNIANLPIGYRLINIRITLSPLTNPTVKMPQDIRLLGKTSGTTVTGCVSPRDDGGILIQKKAIQIAKTKVCTEDLNGTLDANGKCQWPEPYTTEYSYIQL